MLLCVHSAGERQGVTDRPPNAQPLTRVPFAGSNFFFRLAARCMDGVSRAGS